MNDQHRAWGDPPDLVNWSIGVEVIAEQPAYHDGRGPVEVGQAAAGRAPLAPQQRAHIGEGAVGHQRADIWVVRRRAHRDAQHADAAWREALLLQPVDRALDVATLVQAEAGALALALAVRAQ